MPSKKRCGNLKCQSWRGGTRDYSTSAAKEEVVVERAAKKQKTTTMEEGADWKCKCGNVVEGSRTRCGKCQGWRGGTREDIKKMKSKTKKKKSSAAVCKEEPRSDLELAGEAVDDVEEDEQKLDDVACCLCKCAVDYSDGFFFLPEAAADVGDLEGGGFEAEGNAKPTVSTIDAAPKPPAATADRDNTKPSFVEVDAPPAAPRAAIDNAKPAVASTTERYNSQAAASLDEIDSSKPAAASTAEIDNSHPAASSDKIDDIQPSAARTDVSSVGTDASAANLAEHHLVNGASASVDDADIAQAVEENDRNPLSTDNIPKEEIQTDGNQEDSSESSQPPFQLPRRFHDPGNSLILCDGPEYVNRRKSGGAPQYKCERAYHQLCHFIPGEIFLMLTFYVSWIHLLTLLVL